MTEQLLTANEVASWLNIKKQTLQSLAKKGRIPAHKIGRSWRFKRSDVQQYISTTSNQTSIEEGIAK